MKVYYPPREFIQIGLRLAAIALSSTLLATSAMAADRSAWPTWMTATDVAFWKPYEVDATTYALIHFDDPELKIIAGKVAGPGKMSGTIAPRPEGKFGASAHFDGSGYLSFPMEAMNPVAMWDHPVAGALSLEAWIKLERYPEKGKTSIILLRPNNKGQSSGFSLSVDAEGALCMDMRGFGRPAASARGTPGTIPLNQWVHVAGISCGGHLSVNNDTLYVNGAEVFRGSGSGAGGDPEKEAAELFVGGGPDGGAFVGDIDEVRIHSRVQRFWPLDPAPWIERIAKNGMPPIDDVLDRDSQPLLTFPLDGNTKPLASAEMQARDPAITERHKVDFQGEYAPGVKGEAANGPLKIGGFRLADWNQGAMEFWVRPRGMNNMSDKNLGLFSGSGLTAYLFNTVNSPKPLSFFFQDQEKKLRMQSDGSGTEFHPGRWYHLAFTWDPATISMFIDGKLAASGANKLANEANKGILGEMSFNSAKDRPFGDIDELCFYERKLSADEVANRYWSYVDPAKIIKTGPAAPLSLNAWRLPSFNMIYYQLSALPGLGKFEKATIELTDTDGKTVVKTERAFSDKTENIETPKLADGMYKLSAVVSVDGKELRSEPVPFESARFPWEGNELGITNEIFPPFQPIKADGKTASVVLRTYLMNGFGLWDSVLSQGRELLAAPIRLRYETEAGEEGKWDVAEGAFATSAPHMAEYKGTATSAALVAASRSEIEMDGMMRVTLRLSPGAKPTAIKRLWLEIPVKSSEATLMHEDTGSLRSNYSGTIPQGDGVVWKSKRKEGWRNAFAGYVWVGGLERGIAWFAENDKGWMTEKKLSDKPLQEIVRSGNAVVIRINLVNTPSTITEELEIVFGLQASPTKPMPEDWRTGARGGGLAVHPWGGLSCAHKFPYEDRWEIVDKVIESQLTGKDNSEWFKEQQKTHNIPPVYGTTPWTQSIAHFAGRNTRPTMVYFEEMSAPTDRKEWHVYKDEWSRDLLPCRRSWPDADIFRQGNQASPGYRSNFIRSYRDYGAFYTNEWLKRGVGIYWDNSYLTPATNTLTSNAYLAEDGQTQPALALWNQRDYSKRTWNLMHRWQRERKEKLLFLQHMTNTNLLPILSWCTTSFDMEWSSDAYARVFPDVQNKNEPFHTDLLQAQSMGRQVGNYPCLCHGLFNMKQFGVDPKLIPKNEMDRPESPESSIYSVKREWGMQKVHELPGPANYIITAAKLNKALMGFGYDSPKAVVHNYWAETPALTIDRDDVKWLLLARPADKCLLLILQSWSRDPGKVKIRFDPSVIGFEPVGAIANLETGAVVGAAGAAGFDVTLDTPYDFKMIGVGVKPPPAGTLFHDDFLDGPTMRWKYVPSFLSLVESGNAKTLRFGKNEAPWQGPARIEMWDGADSGKDAALTIKFRVPTPVEKRVPLITIVTRGESPQWSQHGLSHTLLSKGQFIELIADPEKKSLEMSRWIVDSEGKNGKTSMASLGTLDDDWHTISIAMKGAETKIIFDQREATVLGGTPEKGTAFGIRGSTALSDKLFVEVGGVTLTALADK